MLWQDAEHLGELPMEWPKREEEEEQQKGSREGPPTR